VSDFWLYWLLAQIGPLGIAAVGIMLIVAIVKKL
jgi:hypothetical protein